MRRYLFVTLLIMMALILPFSPVFADTTNLAADGEGTDADGHYGGIGSAGDYTDINSDDGDTSYYTCLAAGTYYHSWTWSNPGLPAGSVINSVSIVGKLYTPNYPPQVTYGTFYYRTGGNRYYGSSFLPTASYATYGATWNTNPSTGLAWTEAGVNAAEFGLKLSANTETRMTYAYVIVTYTAPTEPTTETDAATDITYSGGSHNATLNGDVTDDGNADILERGFAWGTTSNTTTPGDETPPASYTANWSEFSSDFGEAAFDHNIGGLTLCTTYYFRAYSRNSEGYDWGDEESFMTLCDPDINARAATYVEATTARLNSRVITDGGQDADVRFCYGTVDYSSNCTNDATCNQTTCSCSGYNTTSTWVEDTYETGDTPYLDVSGLVVGTTYYYCVQIRNDVSCRCGGQESFTTESGINEPNTFVGIPYADSISLSWVKDDGSTNTLIRYKLGSYPTGVADGTEVYFDSETSVVHEDLTSGTTYYYVAWGESGGTYSTDNTTLMVTTLASVAPSDDYPVPDEPSAWFQAPSYTSVRWLPFYGIVNFAAEQFEMPYATMWYLLALATCVAVGVLFYSGIGNHNLLLSMIAVGFAMGMFVVMDLIPGWHLIPYGVICAVGIFLGERR